ncbi:MAG: filamentous hemagglutinin N-terminal domain-containing protein [Betaproteobacteria bacterium]|nr:filamentous hemagglutinin N-terminal domain-containing protein [Betaproteobacteria bacterium]
MNKHLHRIVFNAARACLMAVAETSRAHGKAAAGERGAACTHAAPPVGFHLNRLQWVCWLSIGAVMALNTSPAALAQTVVIADPNAPRNQQPTVLRSGNQTVQVNIQTPNAAGLSRNSYKQFDVMADGVILNNSRTNVSTQLGGWVEANPWLAKGTAKVILNQVNSIHPSLLKGAVEVAGQRADVIIANPAGISVNGATFINSVQVNLTTGTPQFDNNNLTGFQVRGGLVDIDGLGLDTSQADYTAILGRAVTLNAKVWANDLKIATGLNDLPSDSLIPSTNPNIKPDSNTTAPSFALDVSRLGGMYAGKIQLIGTEAGLGVRNGGSIQASNGPLVVSQDGWISNTGNMLASQQLQIDTTGKFDNSGSMYATGSLGIQSGDTQTHSGITAALGSVNLQTQGDRKADIISQQHATIASGLQPDGKLTDAQALTVQANGTVQLAGQTLSLGQLRLQGDSVDVSQGTLSANTYKPKTRWSPTKPPSPLTHSTCKPVRGGIKVAA